MFDNHKPLSPVRNHNDYRNPDLTLDIYKPLIPVRGAVTHSRD